MDGVLSDFEGSFSGNYGPDTLKTRDKKLWTQEWPDFILNKKGFCLGNYLALLLSFSPIVIGSAKAVISRSNFRDL
jgi:hypothetical protein